MSSRRIEDLHPQAQTAFLKFESILEANKVQYVRACTYRDDKEQQDLYNQGRTAPGKIVTHAKPGQSKHNFKIGDKPASLAADYYPLINGKLADRKTQQERDLWAILAAAADKTGLTWGGNWPEPKTDFPHFEYPLITNPKPEPTQAEVITALIATLENGKAQLEKIENAIGHALAVLNKMKGQ
jgi:peptidoglycan L-alanyl-D-glutamate endopeptidase CwlK